MSVFFGSKSAPGSGRFLEYLWQQNGVFTPGVTAVASAALVKGGAGPTGNFWALTGSPIIDTLNGLIGLAKFPAASGGQVVLTAPFPVQDPNGEIASLEALEPIQQYVYECEVAAGVNGPGPAPNPYTSAFYLLEGVTRPANGPGSGSAFTCIGFGLNGGGWDCFANGSLGVPTILAQPSVNALKLNTLTLQILRPSFGQAGIVQWYVNGSKILTKAFSALPAFTSASSNTLSCNWQVAAGGSLLYVRAARVLAGPIDPSVYQT